MLTDHFAAATLKNPRHQDTPMGRVIRRLQGTLIPMTLIGAWHTKSGADCEAVAFLSGRPYQKTEESIARLLQFDDCPVWSVGQYRGVASKIDALFAIKGQITEKDLTDFLLLAEYVLSESDPALDLPEDQRWAAGLYTARCAITLPRCAEGICETLVILSVHGNNLFHDRPGIDVEGHISYAYPKASHTADPSTNCSRRATIYQTTQKRHRLCS